MAMSRLPVPIVVVVTGEGGSGGALALAVGDRVLMMENSYYSVISPEGCSTILFKDAAQAPRAAAGAAHDGAGPAAAQDHGRRSFPSPRAARTTIALTTAQNLKTAIVKQLRGALPALAGRAAREALRALPDVRHAGSPAGASPTGGEAND